MADAVENASKDYCNVLSLEYFKFDLSICMFSGIRPWGHNYDSIIKFLCKV